MFVGAERFLQHPTALFSHFPLMGLSLGLFFEPLALVFCCRRSLSGTPASGATWEFLSTW